MALGKKDKMFAWALCLFFGLVGAHHFYWGNYERGVSYVFTLGYLGIGWIYDLAIAIPFLWKKDR